MHLASGALQRIFQSGVRIVQLSALGQVLPLIVVTLRLGNSTCLAPFPTSHLGLGKSNRYL